MALPEKFQVEVAYGIPERQAVISLWIEPGATVAEAVQQSGIAALFPEIDMPSSKFGIFGRRAESTAVLAPGDRVEIYRDLVMDPKMARRLRANANVHPIPLEGA